MKQCIQDINTEKQHKTPKQKIEGKSPMENKQTQTTNVRHNTKHKTCTGNTQNPPSPKKEKDQIIEKEKKKII